MKKIGFALLILVTWLHNNANGAAQYPLCYPYKSSSENSASNCTIVQYNTVGADVRCINDPDLGDSDIVVHLVGSCTSGMGDGPGALQDEPTLRYRAIGRYCWCRRTEPTVSNLVYVTEFMNILDCYNDCSYNCAYMLASIPNLTRFRRNMLGETIVF